MNLRHRHGFPLTRPAILLEEGRPDTGERRKSSLPFPLPLSSSVLAFKTSRCFAHANSRLSIKEYSYCCCFKCRSIEFLNLSRNQAHIPLHLALESPEWNDKGSYPILLNKCQSDVFPPNEVFLEWTSQPCWLPNWFSLMFLRFLALSSLQRKHQIID